MMVSRPTKPRGRPPQYVNDRNGNPIVGLSRNPETAIRKKNGKTYHVTDGRYYATGSKPRVYFGSDFDLAVRRFRAWQARERGQKVEVEYDVPLSPESKKKHDVLRRAYGKPPVGDSLPVTDSLPEEVFWGKVRELLIDANGRRLAAQKTGIKELEWLFDLEPPPPPMTLEEIGNLYVSKKPPIGSDERKQVRQFWRQFREIVGVDTLGELTQEHIRNYCNRVYEIQEDNGHKPSYIDKRFGKIKTVVNWLDKMNLSPDQSRRVRAMLTVLIAPKKRKSLPTPISRADVERLLKVATTEEAAIVLLGLNCAFYPVDCRMLTKGNGLDLERGVYSAYRHKTEIPQCAVLWQRTVKAVNKHLAENPNPTDYIFVTSTGRPYGAETFRRMFVALRDRAGVKEAIKFDHLRDGAATHADAPSRQIDVLLGHEAPGLTARYRLRHPEMVEHACKTVDAHYFPMKRRSKK